MAANYKVNIELDTKKLDAQLKRLKKQVGEVGKVRIGGGGKGGGGVGVGIGFGIGSGVGVGLGVGVGVGCSPTYSPLS